MDTTAIAHWHDFFLMTGSAAATLIGLVFIAITIHIRPSLLTPGRAARSGSHVLAFASIFFASTASPTQ